MITNTTLALAPNIRGAEMLRKRRFRSALLEFRKERDLSQAQLGQLIGCARQTVANWEAGRFTPDRKRLRALKRAGLNTDPFMAPVISGATIRQWRDRHDITQPELAEALGLSVSAISHWELNNKQPRADIRFALYSLGCPDNHGNRCDQPTRRTAKSGPCARCADYHDCKQLVDAGLWAICEQLPPTAGTLIRASQHLELGTFHHNDHLTTHIIDTLAEHSIDDALDRLPDPAYQPDPGLYDGADAWI